MKDEKMNLLISDVNVLIYIHDIIALKEKDSDYIYSDTYKQLHENDTVTIIKYLRKTIFVILSFVIMILLMKFMNIKSLDIRYVIFLIISTFYGILFVTCKEDIKGLIYQLKAKKAVQYALLNYTYDEYKLYLDQYLSVLSTKNYLQETIIIRNIKTNTNKKTD